MPKPEKVLRQNVLTAMGAICLDEGVRIPYLQGVPPAPLMHQNNIPITDAEVADLTTLVSLTHKPEEVAVSSICPRRPCVYSTVGIETVVAAAVMDDPFRAAMFESSDPNFDPSLVAYEYGFDLTPDEHVLLHNLLTDKKNQARKKEISAALTALGTKIKNDCAINFILKKKMAKVA